MGHSQCSVFNTSRIRAGASSYTLRVRIQLCPLSFIKWINKSICISPKEPTFDISTHVNHLAWFDEFALVGVRARKPHLCKEPGLWGGGS